MTASILQIAGVVGGIGFVVAAVIAVVNRGIREDRIVHLTGLVNELQIGLNNERANCAEHIKDMADRISHLQGQIDAATGELGERIGRAIAAEVMERLSEAGQ